MLEFDLKYLRKMKIWFKQNDDLILQGNNIDRKEFISPSVDSVVNSTVIVELFIPRGGRNVYGLLGTDYISTASKNVVANISSGNILRSKLFSTSLMGVAEPVQLCLPDNLRFAILEELQLLSNSNELNINGRLDFHYGAFSEISSSEWIFRKLTKIVVKLLGFSEKEVSRELFDRLIDE